MRRHTPIIIRMQELIRHGARGVLQLGDRKEQRMDSRHGRLRLIHTRRTHLRSSSLARGQESLEHVIRGGDLEMDIKRSGRRDRDGWMQDPRVSFYGFKFSPPGGLWEC